MTDSKQAPLSAEEVALLRAYAGWDGERVEDIEGITSLDADELTLRLLDEHALLRPDNARLTAELARLRDPMCNTCGGTPPISGRVCVCGGTGKHWDEERGLRLECHRLDGEVARLTAELAEVLDKQRVVEEQILAVERDHQADRDRLDELCAAIDDFDPERDGSWLRVSLAREAVATPPTTSTGEKP